jgi:hypothetical protein
MKIKLLLFLAVFSYSLTAQHIMTVDFNKTVHPIKDLTNVNKGSSKYLANGYSDAAISLVRLHDYHGANDYCYYSNFWNFDSSSQEFTTINTSFNPDSSNQYNWGNLDSTLYELNQYGILPYVRFGTSYPGPRHIIQPISPPFDSDGINFTNFSKLCKRTIMHTNYGWDKGTHYDIKYWEIWNEPAGLFWDGTPLEFYKMFSTVMDTLKRNFPTLKIGGPGAHPSTTLEATSTYGIDFLNYLRKNSIPLDFYSWHIYNLLNPYLLNGIAEKIRTKLDSTGFTETESHISEINHALKPESFSYFDSNSKGTAYYSSLLITAQKSSVDKLFWYTGEMFFFNDGSTYNWIGDGLKYYSEIIKNTSEQIFSSGDLVIEVDKNVDTTNVMLLASKSDDDKSIYLLLSNYNSDINSFNIKINNLPWSESDSIIFTQTVTKNPSVRRGEIIRYISGGSSINLNLINMTSPSVALMKLEKQKETTGIKTDSFTNNEYDLSQNYPNPFNPTTNIKYSTNIKTFIQLNVYDVLGKKIITLVNEIQDAGTYDVTFNADNFPSGIYYYQLKVGNSVETKKMVLLK